MCYIETTNYGECVVPVDREQSHIYEGPNLIHRIKTVAWTANNGPVPERHYIVSACGTDVCLEHLIAVELSDMSQALADAGLHRNTSKTHCVKHTEPYVTRVRKDRKQRVCRSCQAAHSRAYRARRKKDGEEQANG